MKHASDFIRRPVPRRYPWRQWAYFGAQLVAFLVASIAFYALLVFGLAI